MPADYRSPILLAFVMVANVAIATEGPPTDYSAAFRGIEGKSSPDLAAFICEQEIVAFFKFGPNSIYEIRAGNQANVYSVEWVSKGVVRNDTIKCLRHGSKTAVGYYNK